MTDAATLRGAFRHHTAELRADPGKLDDFLVAVSEVTVNSILHGQPPVNARVWIRPWLLLATICDHGPGPDPFAGILPPSDPTDGGHGLRIARSLVDQLDISRTAHGSQVRIGLSLKPS